jgi:hypothetical protein
MKDRKPYFCFSTNRLPESYVCYVCKEPFVVGRKPENIIRGQYDTWVKHECQGAQPEDSE